MNLEVLVPTHNKTLDECITLRDKLNVSSDCLICNQNGNELIKELETTRIVCKSNVGVSNNRNNLLEYATGDICICIDDDCPLVDNYSEIVKAELQKFPEADFILFNGTVTHENNRLIHNKKTKKVSRFKDISYGGGPGLVFKKSAIKKYNLKYNTKVGYPNKISFGEDSLFLKSLVSAGANIIRSSKILFIIKDDVDNSSYFVGVNEDFVRSKGCITKTIYPTTFWLLKYYYAFKLRKWRNNKFSFLKLVHLLKEGAKLKNTII